MHSCEQTSYGFKISISEFFSLNAAQAWLKDYNFILNETIKVGKKDFGQFIDLRGFKPGPPEAQQIITDSMKKFKESGGGRSIVLFDNPISAMQIKRLAKETGIYQWERYIDTQSNPNFDTIVKDWLINGVDPNN